LDAHPASLLGAIKRAVDDAQRPGRFLLTGSVRADLDVPGWPGTGRLLRVPMWGWGVFQRLSHNFGLPRADDL
jgi:hypothetical protein